MEEIFTVRIPTEYSIRTTMSGVSLHFDNKDVLHLTDEKFAKVVQTNRVQIPFYAIEEIIQKKANMTQVKLINDSRLTINSKHGMRLFKFLYTDENEKF